MDQACAKGRETKLARAPSFRLTCIFQELAQVEQVLHQITYNYLEQGLG
jgi:hypothetical protein